MVSFQLIQSVIQKDNAAYKQLYNTCIPYVYSVVKRYIRNNEDQKDILQEIFAKVFLNIKSYDAQKGTFRPWLRKIAVNECLMFLRKSSNIAMYPIDNQPVLIDNSSVELIDSLTRNDIMNLLQEMPKGYKAVFIAYIIDGYDHNEIGKILGITKDTSRSQLSRAKKWVINNIKKNNKYKAYGLF